MSCPGDPCIRLETQRHRNAIRVLGISAPTYFIYVTFPKIKNLIGPYIISVAERSMKSALREEIEAETGECYGE